MHFVFDDGATTHDVEVIVNDPDAVVADLARALGDRADEGWPLVLDGRQLVPQGRLDRAGIADGAVVRFAGSTGCQVETPPAHRSAPADEDAGIVVVEVIGGLAAGQRTGVIAAGSWSIGRRGANVTIDDPTISAVHARLDVAVDGTVVLTDDGSLNGTWLDDRPVVASTAIEPDDVVRLGASHLRIGRPQPGDRLKLPETGRRFTGGNAVAFNRPPRPMQTIEPEPIEPPTAPIETSGTSTVGIIGALAPLLLGLVMVKVFHSWLYGMFALLSPVMLVGNAIESKRRSRRSRRRDLKRFAEELAAFTDALARSAARERGLRHEHMPALPDIVRWATAPTTRLWERRPAHADFLVLRAGLGRVRWDPPVEGRRRGLAAEVQTAMDDVSLLESTPFHVDLTAGGVVGIVGPRAAALALSRALVVQAATLHGPADLPIAVLAARDRADDWDWAKWLPHTAAQSGSRQRMLADHPDDADRLLRELLEHAPPEQQERRNDAPTLLLVIDDESLTEGRRCPARSVLRGLAGPIAGLVVAETDQRLPALCSTVIEVDENGEAVVHRLAAGEQVDGVLVNGMPDRAARDVARALARFDDPELDATGARLPDATSLLPLLALDPPTADALLQRWQEAGTDPDLVAPIGTAEDRVLAVDLVRDGPHCLIGGTTGSGKSELLRSLVAGLAAGCSPDHLTFVLIDFKGGSAFDQCARLPHTVGMVTDLDEHLGARALRCLEAELRHRERRLRSAGVSSLTEYRRQSGPADPLPRLVVVIDEFATLKTELPDFVEALVGIAQRGRSLGVHLVLATQRPSGAVSENIRANANLRIALRVHDANDSRDLIDAADAASISRDQPGRALVRLGPGEVIAVQTALSTGVAVPGGRAAVEVRPFRLAATPPDSSDISCCTTEPAATDLSRLVDAARAAFEAAGLAPPRRPWPEPLPAHVDLDDIGQAEAQPRFGAPGALLAFALSDIPDQQTRRPTGWVPADGNLLMVGVGGSGTTTALGSIALAAARSAAPDDLHVYMLDFGVGELAPLARLPHTAAVITGDERERQSRLLRHLIGELQRRRALPDARTSEARLLLLLDGIAGFRSVWDDADPSGLLDDLLRLFADGPEVGLHMAVSADRPGAVPNAMTAVCRQRLILRLGDRLDYGIYGIAGPDVPALGPGGAILGETSIEVRIGRPTPDLATAVDRLAATSRSATARPPEPVCTLPTDVDADAVGSSAQLGEHPWFVPIGIGDATLGPVGFTLHQGEHALIAGPPRSGRTTALQTVARVVHRRRTDVTIVAVAGPRSCLAATGGVARVLAPDDAGSAFEEIGDIAQPVLILVDDADLVGDELGEHPLQRLLDLRRPDLHVVAAGRSEALRQRFTHWTRNVRTSRCGLLLQPDLDLDGDLLGSRLPRRPPVTLGVGRGYLVTDGAVDVVQTAHPPRSRLT